MSASQRSSSVQGWSAAVVIAFLLSSHAGSSARAQPVQQKEQGCSFDPLQSDCTFKKDHREFSYLVFSSTWPGTFCRDGCCRLPNGVSALEPGFTIHGLWPNFAGPEYPTCCTSPFTVANVQTMLSTSPKLTSTLEQYWPVLKRCDFIAYEYEKHGTCAATVYGGTTGPLDYLGAAVGLRLRWNFLRALVQAGVYTSPEDFPVYFSLHDMVRPALEKTTGTKVVTVCEQDEHGGDLLAEVRVCVTANAHSKYNPVAIDCDEQLIAANSNCHSPKGVRLPDFPRVVEPSPCPPSVL